MANSTRYHKKIELFQTNFCLTFQFHQYFHIFKVFRLHFLPKSNLCLFCKKKLMVFYLDAKILPISFFKTNIIYPSPNTIHKPQNRHPKSNIEVEPEQFGAIGTQKKLEIFPNTTK